MNQPNSIGSAFWKNEFLLRPDIHFLNFGSFGACPKIIFEDYQNWQRQLEAEPVQFIAFDGPSLLAQSRLALANFVQCSPDDLVYVTNPTYAVNIVAKSLQLTEGDEILTTHLEYGACDKTWEFYCEKHHANYIKHQVHLPLENEDDFIESFLTGVTNRTKLVFISHITSTTGLRLPVEKLAKRIQALGIPIFIDGAHAPGHIPLDLSALDPDYYTGACHKWMLTAKGSSFLYVKSNRQASLEPLLVSWGYKSAKPSHSLFIDYHQMQGTRDFSAFLTIPKAIAYMREHRWDDLSKQCRANTLYYGKKLLETLKTSALAPLDSNAYGQMFSCPIATAHPEKLQQTLFNEFHVEAPVMVHGSATYLRFSTQVFNDSTDFEALLHAIDQLISRGMVKGV